MKLTSSFTLFVSLTISRLLADTTGYVFCDANQSGQFDSGDVPVPSVLVVVTNTSGTYSNANWTTTPDGAFVIDLGSATDTYVEYIVAATLPGDAVVVQPIGGVYTFTPDSSNAFSGNFLISSSTCTNGTAPPPPPPASNSITCCLHGGGTIGGHPGRSLFVFAGSAVPACGSTNGDTGEWEILSRPLRLHFQGSVMEIVNCGQDLDTASNLFNFIEFQGVGTLKGIAGLRTNSGVVYFFAHAEDHGHHGHWRGGNDSLYFRVYGADDSTLLLIGGDANTPANVVPVPLSAGRLLIQTNCCDNTTESDNDDDQGETGSGMGNHHGGDNTGPGENHGSSNGQSEDEASAGGSHSGGNAGGQHGGSSAANHGHSGSGHSTHGQASGHGQNGHGHGG